MRLKVRPAVANRPGCTVAGSRPLRPRVRHSLRTKLAHEGLEMGASDQPLLLCDDVGEDLLPALAHLGRGLGLGLGLGLGAMSECKVGGVRGSTRPQHLRRGLVLPV